ncbi:MAG: SDR family NAD(P)-dependent oxidoreductase [Pseudomonadota bacterium]
MARVLVTGGGSGIGRGIARHFAQSGNNVTITGRRSEALAQTADGHDITCVTSDVSQETEIAAVLAEPFDVVIANAGISMQGRVSDVSLDDWDRIMRVNLTGTFLTFREALKSMQPGGRLIAIASTAGLQGGPNISPYVASKHGVIGFVKAVAQEVARKGITCNAVCPGFVDTDMADAAVSGVAQKFGISEEDAAARITSRNPMRRMIHVDEVVAAVAFLASAEASSINGHALSVSGGEI